MKGKHGFLFSVTSACLFLGAGALSMACSQRPPVSDDGCAFSRLAIADDTDDGTGQLQVVGSTSVQYYVLDNTGKQLAQQHLNQPVALKPGRYRVKLNNSVRDVEVWDGYLARCASGTLTISGTTGESYYVTDSLDRQLAVERLGKTISLFAGRFNVRLNNTELAIGIKPDQMTKVRTGSIVVHGATNEFYHVLDENNKQLNFSKLGEPLSLLPGSYRVHVNNTMRPAQVFAGKATELVTGTLSISGLTDELYYVTDTTGNALNFQKLNNALALFPGSYNIQLNNSQVRGDVRAGQVTEFNTGSLTLRGPGSEYYYVLNDAGKQLNYNSLNRWLSFFPSQYVVKLGGSTQKATVVAGHQTSLEALE